MTQREYAINGNITEEMKKVAISEGLKPEEILKLIAKGVVVITKNIKHNKIEPMAIGKGLRTKVNANIGTSKDHYDTNEELEKLRVAIEAGADSIMDLSTGGPIDEIRKTIIAESTVPVGTVPIYQAVIDNTLNGYSLVEMTEDHIFKTIEKHLMDGVDFITVHCGVTKKAREALNKSKRIMGVVSRGGAFMLEWMAYNKKENPLFEHFDMLLDIAKDYDIVLSLGDGLRPGCIADATDMAQIQELITLGELTQRAWDAGVQVMIEGPGHVPLNQIEANVLMEKRLCHEAPFYVLGPLVTDITPGYDHITGAIGGAIAGSAGADFLCYLTPSEHLRLPTIEDVKEGVIATKIAAHAADIAKGVRGSIERDIQMSQNRKKLNWKGQFELSIDPKKAEALRSSSLPEDNDVCTMCADYCAIKASNRALSKT